MPNYNQIPKDYLDFLLRNEHTSYTLDELDIFQDLEEELKTIYDSKVEQEL